MNTNHLNKLTEELGEDHIGTSAENPIRKDAFLLSDSDLSNKYYYYLFYHP